MYIYINPDGGLANLSGANTTWENEPANDKKVLRSVLRTSDGWSDAYSAHFVILTSVDELC